MFLSEQDRKDLKDMKNWVWKNKKKIVIGAGVLILINDHYAIKQLVKDNALLLRSAELLSNEQEHVSVSLDELYMDTAMLFDRIDNMGSVITKQGQLIVKDRGLFEKYFGPNALNSIKEY